MKGDTIKTLAEYITSLHRENPDFFKNYENNQFDSNGVEQDHIEKLWSTDNHECPGT